VTISTTVTPGLNIALLGFQVINRTGDYLPFDNSRILHALEKAFKGHKKQGFLTMEALTNQVTAIIKGMKESQQTITVESIQDIVEFVLKSSNETDAWKRYTTYRQKQAEIRSEREVPPEIKEIYEGSAKYFPTQLQQFQFFDKYSRYDEELGRREAWAETVERAVKQLTSLAGGKLTEYQVNLMRQNILEMKVIPSMRLMAMAGPALEKNHIAQFNCSYVPIDHWRSFVEALIISMNGCGVGFSVESDYIHGLPPIVRRPKMATATVYDLALKGEIEAVTGTIEPQDFFQKILITDSGVELFPDGTLVISDSAEGWADALALAVQTWWRGGDLTIDYSKIRPAGTPLKTKGGSASGSGPFKDMLEAIKKIFLKRQGSSLTTLDCHDIMCHIGSAAVAGGVRRTALLSLFDFSDEDMLHCKDPGNFSWGDPKDPKSGKNSQRANANNSAVWPEDRELSQLEVADFVMAMLKSGRGEPGIFNRKAVRNMLPERRPKTDSDGNLIKWGINPCAEIVLKPMEMCNLSAVIARPDDTFETLSEKVMVATLIGTIQSMATNFKGLRPEWRENCESERLLGVDITGQMDCPVIQDAEVMQKLRIYAVECNKVLAEVFGINQSVSVTTVKPSGNSSVLTNCSSGIHARWADYYVRNVRVGAHTPVAKVLLKAGVPMLPENGEDPVNPKTWVAQFPIKSPEGAITRNGRSALEQCDYWLLNKLNWAEHSVSVTITYKPTEIIDLITWIWNNRNVISGMAFLPSYDSDYPLLPYQEVTKEEYERLVEASPEKVDWAQLYSVEYSGKFVEAAKLLACVANGSGEDC
jgi:ribonucleoside-triphosphate reductase